MEWTMLLSILLLDSSLVAKVVDVIQKQSTMLDFAVLARLMCGYDELYTWAETEWSARIIIIIVRTYRMRSVTYINSHIQSHTVQVIFTS